MKKIILIIPILFLLLACEKPVIEDPAPEVGLYDQVWTSNYHPEKNNLHSHPHIYDNKIIVAQQNSFEKVLDYNIAGFNKITGEMEWTWNHPDPSTIILDSYGHENYLFVRAWNSIFMFDIQNQTILWEIDNSDDMKNIGRPIFHNERMYLSVASRNIQNFNKVSQLRVYNLLTGEYTILYSEEENQIKPYKPTVGIPTFFELENGEKRMVFDVRYLSNSSSPRETLPDLLCFDFNSKDLLWRVTDYNELVSGPVTIKYHNGKLYNTGDWSLYAFDPETGEELNRWQFWESYPLGSFNNCDFTIVNDVVYTLDDLGHLNGINTVTEDFEFSYKKGAARTTSPPTIHNDLILYSSLGHESIEIFDTKKKAFVHKERNRSFGNDIVYDEETELYFTTTPYFVHAFRIHDE